MIYYVIGSISILALAGCTLFVPPTATTEPPTVREGVVYHPETGKAVNCEALLAWQPEYAGSATKSMDFNREVGGTRGVMLGLSPSQVLMGMKMREACRSVSQPAGKLSQ